MISADLNSLLLSFKLATITVIILLIISIPLAKWLAFSKHKSVRLGSLFVKLTHSQLIFSFTGLVFASVIYSLPFVVQPMIATFNNIGQATVNTALSMGASRKTIFWKIILPLSKTGITSAAILGFVHTLGEFGVILMVGGNIPNQTRVVSIEIFNHVENMELQQANQLSLILVVISFVVIFWMNTNNKNNNSQIIT